MCYLHDARPYGNGGQTGRQRLRERVYCAGLTVFLYHVTAATEEGHQFAGQVRLLPLCEDLPDARENFHPQGVRQLRVTVAQLGQRVQKCGRLQKISVV